MSPSRCGGDKGPVPVCLSLCEYIEETRPGISSRMSRRWSSWACFQEKKTMKLDEKTIFHVDVNSAFLSWSALRQLEEEPGSVDLRTIPSAVGGDVQTRHGVITAKSIPAKKYGIQTGEPVVKALQKCPHLVLVRSDFETYRRYSHALMDLLAQYTPLLQQMSIDEAFLDLTERIGPDNREGALALAQEIRDRVREELGFTVNVGISSNKLLAKMASDFQSVLGERSGIYIHNSANGISRSKVTPEREQAKSVSNERTLSRDIDRDNYQTDGLPVIRTLSQKVAGRLQKSSLVGQTVTFQVKSSEFNRYSRQTMLSDMTDRAEDIEKAALYLADRLLNGPDGLFEDGISIRLIGVGVSRLSEKQMMQMDLFQWADQNEEEEKKRREEQKLREKEEELARQAETARRKEEEKLEKMKNRQTRLDSMMDQINGRYGKGTIKKGSR